MSYYAGLAIPGIAIGVFASIVTALTIDFTLREERMIHMRTTAELFDQIKEAGYDRCVTEIFGERNELDRRVSQSNGQAER